MSLECAKCEIPFTEKDELVEDLGNKMSPDYENCRYYHRHCWDELFVRRKGGRRWQRRLANATAILFAVLLATGCTAKFSTTSCPPVDEAPQASAALLSLANHNQAQSELSAIARILGKMNQREKDLLKMKKEREKQEAEDIGRMMDWMLKKRYSRYQSELVCVR